MQARSVSPRKRQRISESERDRIVLDHLSLVKAIAIRVHENLPVHVDLDDLVHSGVLGLFDAVEKFEPSKNVAFQAYAKHRIKGAILDSLRQLDWASRDLRRRQKQAEAVTRDLSSRLGRAPEESEVAGELGLGVERWRRMLAQLQSAGPAPEPASTDQDRERRDPPAKPDLRPDRIAERRQLRNTLARAIDSLPARHQKVVFLYYTNDMTMREIGQLMGVNESRVSQIHKTALKKMAAALESVGIHSAAAF